MEDRKEALARFTPGDVDYVVERELAFASNYASHSDPSAVLLADQPGAGKTILSAMLNRTFGGDAFFINADEYRRFHPNYRKLYETYGTDVVSMTSDFSSAVTERLIQGLSERKINLIIEGTGRTTEVPHHTAELLTGQSYRVELAAIAVRPVVSLCSTLLRFYKMNEGGTIPRATAMDAHDHVVAVLPGNLDKLNDDSLLSRVTIWTRELDKLFDCTENPGRPSNALLQYWNRPWFSEEIQSVKRSIAVLREKERLSHFRQGSAIDELERRFQYAVQSPTISPGMTMS